MASAVYIRLSSSACADQDPRSDLHRCTRGSPPPPFSPPPPPLPHPFPPLSRHFPSFSFYLYPLRPLLPRSLVLPPSFPPFRSLPRFSSQCIPLPPLPLLSHRSG